MGSFILKHPWVCALAIVVLTATSLYMEYIVFGEDTPNKLSLTYNANMCERHCGEKGIELFFYGVYDGNFPTVQCVCKEAATTTPPDNSIVL